MDRINQLLQQLAEADKSNQDLVDDLTDMIYMLRKAKDPYTRDLIKQNIREINRKLQEKNLLPERKLSKKEIKTRDKYADDLPDKDFKKRYGKDWESVKYATATKMAKKKNEDVNESLEPGTEVVLVGRYDLMKPYGNNTSTTPDPLLRYEVVGYNGIARNSNGKRLDTYIIQDEEGGQWEVADYSIEQTTGKYQPYTGKEHGVASSVAPDKHYGDIGTHDPKVQAAIDQAFSSMPNSGDFYDTGWDEVNAHGNAAPPSGKRIETRKKIERHQREKAERERIKALKQKRRNEDVEQELMDQWLAEKADPCWKGYEMIGMKKKGNKDVPNCVPKKGKKKS